MHARTHSHAHARIHAHTRACTHTHIHTRPAGASGSKRPDLPRLIPERVAKAHGLRARIHSPIHSGIYWVPSRRQARGKLWE